MTALAPGAKVGPYEIAGLLGTGGMGEVYRAKDPRLGRDVAVKVLPDAVATDSDRLRRFENEARAAGGLNHPNIMAVYDVGRDGGTPYVVCELLDGQTLRERMGEGLGVKKAVDVAVQVAHGLAAAHEKGIVHRDLKPENVFLTRDGRVKVLDFGLAKLLGPGTGSDAASALTTETHGTDAGTVLGTVGYMSPEQVRGVSVDHRSDIFSLGAVLYEMLTAARAFRRDTAPETMTAILREDVPPPSQASPEVTPALDRIVARCLDKHAEERFQSARDLAFALQALSGSTVTSAPAVSARPTSRRRQRIVSTAVAAAVVAAALVVGRAYVREAPPPPTFQRLTFRVGGTGSARFAPDGETVVYRFRDASGIDALFTTRAGSRASRPLDLPDATLFAISRGGEMAVGLLAGPVASMNEAAGEMTLGRVSLSGGAPRPLLENVNGADWMPDGQSLAVLHQVGEKQRVEAPIGTVRYEVVYPRVLRGLRVSPRSGRVAFFEHPEAGTEHGDLLVLDGTGAPRRLVTGFVSLNGLAWGPGGDEVWFSGSERSGLPSELYAVTLTGEMRVLARLPTTLVLHDVGPRGQAVISRAVHRSTILARRPRQPEHDISELDLSAVADLSADGGTIVGSEVGEGGGPNYSIFLRPTDGRPAIWLGDGDAQALSPDGRWVISRLVNTSPGQLVLLPTGPGAARPLPRGDIEHFGRAEWLPGRGEVLFQGRERGMPTALYRQAVDGGSPRLVSRTEVTLLPLGNGIAPDARRLAALAADGRPVVLALDGGEPAPIEGLDAGDLPIRWTPTGDGLFFVSGAERLRVVHRLDLATGRSRVWKEVLPEMPAAIHGDLRVFITPDGETTVVNYVTNLTSLYQVDGLR